MSDIFAGGDGDSNTSDKIAGAGGDLSRPDAATGEPAEVFHDAKEVTIPVNPARLAWGRYDHGHSRDVGEGDIHASYSADTIASAGKIRKAFRWQAQLMVTVSLSRQCGIEQAQAYQLIPLKAFSGTPMGYAEKIGTAESAEAARNDPNGFYHGMTVKHGSEAFVLAGPPVVFAAEEGPPRPDGAAEAEGEQLSLF
jgi:hypothetical protein